MFPILGKKTNINLVSPSAPVKLSLLCNSPGCDSGSVIGRTIHSVDPGGTAQNVHRLCSWEFCGGPFPRVSHHIIKPWIKASINAADQAASSFLFRSTDHNCSVEGRLTQVRLRGIHHLHRPFLEKIPKTESTTVNTQESVVPLRPTSCANVASIQVFFVV